MPPKISLTPEQILEAERIKREKKAIANKKYRENLKKGTNKRSELSYKEYNDGKTEYMRVYRKERKIKLIEARAEHPDILETPAQIQQKVAKVNKKFNLSEARRSTRETKQVDLSIAAPAPIVKPKMEKKMIPLWVRKLPINPKKEDYKEAKNYPPAVRNVMIKKIKTVFTNVLKIPFTGQTKQILSKILSGFPIEGDMKYFKSIFPFLSVNNIYTFLNKVQDYYPKNTSFTTMIIPFVNVLARLIYDGWDPSYQIISTIAKNSSKEYNEMRDENAVAEEDIGKIFDFDPESVKFHIDNFLDDIKEKAIAAVYGLQPPRRLDFQYMKVTEITDKSLLENPKLNYLIVENGEPLKFIYNNYKTRNKYGQQDIDVEDDIVPYLKPWLKKGNFLPVRGDGKYLFGTDKEPKQEDSNFGTKLTNIFYKMYGEEISSRFIRASAATWYNNLKPKPTKSQREAFALKMAHSLNLNMQYEKITENIIGKKEEQKDAKKKEDNTKTETTESGVRRSKRLK